MKINLPWYVELAIRKVAGTDRGNKIIAFCEGNLGDAFDSLKDVGTAQIAGNLERVRIAIDSFMDHLPAPVRAALVAHIIDRYGNKTN